MYPKVIFLKIHIGAPPAPNWHQHHTSITLAQKLYQHLVRCFESCCPRWPGSGFELHSQYTPPELRIADSQIKTAEFGTKIETITLGNCPFFSISVTPALHRHRNYTSTNLAPIAHLYRTRYEHQQCRICIFSLSLRFGMMIAPH